MKLNTPHRILLAVLTLSGGLLFSQEDEKEKEKSSKKKDAPQPLIVFKPRDVGAPSIRVGKATRGGKSDLTLCTITPVSSCLTVDPTPTLYWYQSDNSDGNLEIVLNDPQSFETLFSKTITAPKSKGIHGFDITEEGVSLTAGKEYEWTVTYVIDKRKPSANATAVGRIAVVGADDALKAALSKAGDGVERAKTLAAHGIWYDAFDGISRLIEADPGRAGLKELRDSLIRQAGLSKETQ